MTIYEAIFEKEAKEDDKTKKQNRKRSLIGAGIGAGVGAGSAIGTYALLDRLHKSMGYKSSSPYTRGAKALLLGTSMVTPALLGSGMGRLSATRAREKEKGQRKSAAGQITARRAALLALPGLGIGGGFYAGMRALGKHVGRKAARERKEMPKVSKKTYFGEYLLPGYASGKRIGYEGMKGKKASLYDCLF